MAVQPKTKADEVKDAKSRMWSELGKMLSAALVSPGLIYWAYSRPDYEERLANKFTVLLYILGAAFALAFLQSSWKMLQAFADFLRLKYVEKDEPEPAKEEVEVSFEDPPR